MYPIVGSWDPSRKKGIGLRDKSTGRGGRLATYHGLEEEIKYCEDSELDQR